jgi:hypothetical protein
MTHDLSRPTDWQTPVVLSFRNARSQFLCHVTSWFDLMDLISASFVSPERDLSIQKYYFKSPFIEKSLKTSEWSCSIETQKKIYFFILSTQLIEFDRHSL